MNQIQSSVDQMYRDNPNTVFKKAWETTMNPFQLIKSGLTWIGAVAIGASLASAPAFAQKQTQNGWLQKEAPKNGPHNGAGNLLPGGNGPDPEIKKITFTKSAAQISCKHVRFRIRLALWGTPGFWDNPASPDVTDITGTVSSLKDTLPKGLSWESVSINGDIVNFPALAYSSVNHDKDTFTISGIKITADNSDGIGDPDLREWNVVAIAKIDPAEFPNPKIKKNQAKMRLVTPHSTFEALTHHFGQPDPATWREGDPTKFQVDLTDCDEPDDGGDPEGDPDGEPCIKLEKGEVECEGGAPVPFTYKMPVGPELAGTTIELTSLTPGVVVNPPFQIVPPGGGVLEWDLIGATKGMTIHLLTNNVKQVGPADFDGLATCCTEEIIIDIPEDIPCDDDDKEPDLEVDKKALVPVCDKATGDCKFAIRVKNVGDKKFEGKIALQEWQLYKRAAITSGPNAGWSCSWNAGLGLYICKTGPVTLDPGQSKVLNLGFTLGNGWLGDNIKNCAKLDYTEMGVAPFGDLTNDKDCAQICVKGSNDCPDIPDDEKKPELEIRKFDAGTHCIGGPQGVGACWINYSIIIHNFGDGDYNGPLTVSDSFDVKPDNVQFNPIPPWVCATVNGKDFDCNHPVTNIPANGQMILQVVAKFNNPDLVEPKTITNCATLEEAEPGKDKDCAQGTLPDHDPKDPENDGKPDLSIEKSCKPGVLGGLISCRIAIRNNGASAPSGVIRIFDVARVIGTEAPLVAQDVTPDGPEWSCEGAPANDLACMIDGSHLTPGTTRYFEAKIKLTGKGNQRYRNCATAHHEPVEGGDMTMIGQSCVEGGVDIRVEKTGPARCELDQPCTFDVTIKNVSETDFSGLVKIADALGQGLAPAGINVPITNISPPLPCDVQPTQVPFVCTGTLNLAAGESVTHQITLTFDIETELEGGNSLRNCAGVIDGNLAADKKQLGNKNQEPLTESDIVGCHSFEIGKDDTGDQCTPPMVLNNNGVCVCPDGTKWNGRRCVGADPIPPVVPDPERLCKPGKGEVRTSNNRCVCRAGYIRKGPDLCVPPTVGCKPGRNEYKTRKGKCVCKPGYVRNDYGICTKPQTCKPGRNEVKDRYGNCVCRKGYSRDNNGYCVKLPPLCKLGPNEFRNSQGQCVCKSGYKRGKRGICVKIPDGCKPGRNEYKNAKGQCVCKKGYDRNNYGQCVKIPPLCKPKRNEIRNSKGQCVCISGYQRNNKGICVQPPTTNCKKPNEVKNSKGQCVCKRGYDRNNYGICTKTPTCKPGKNEYRDKNGRCVCKRGFKRNSKGQCVKPTPPKPICSNGSLIKRGKGWYCVCPKGWKRHSLKNGGARCEKPKVCPKGTVGKYPNCRKLTCPKGTVGKYPNCKKLTCPKGTVGKYPNCKKLTCPKGTVGKYPNCKKLTCPKGTVGKYPNCRKLTCPKGTVGKYPNCRKLTCPKGTVGKYPNCRKLTCPKGTVGKYPNCRKIPPKCPSGMYRGSDGKCRYLQ